MTDAPASRASTAGPARWGFREYSVHERPTPFGRRFEVRSPDDQVVLFCRAKRNDPRLVFFADEAESQELFRFEPHAVPRFERSYRAVDALSGQAFAEVRKMVYQPLEKSEWFIVDPEGDPVGMVTETAPEPSLLRRLVPVERLFPKAWAIHWGQSIAGTIQPRPGLVGERLDIDLSLDKRDEIDRRVVLGITVALRSELRRPEDASS